MVRAAFSQIQHLVCQAMASRGDLAEIGVWRGDTLEPLAVRAAQNGRGCYGIDSFCGLAAPGPNDCLDGKISFPQGSLACSRERVQDRLRSAALYDVELIQGFVPEVLNGLNCQLCFAHVDLDHYEPTYAAMKWVWEHLQPGGIVCSHDWFANREALAAGGVKKFMREFGLKPSGEYRESAHVWFVKG